MNAMIPVDKPEKSNLGGKNSGSGKKEKQ